MPEIKLLSNGHYHVMVTRAGGGYSRWNDLEVTRWREDATRDPWGTFCYLREHTPDVRVWSATLQPTLRRPGTAQADFSGATAVYTRIDAEIETRTEVAVAADSDVELRRVTVTNLSARPRTLDATSYAEIVLATPGADAAHPAFSKLFVETEIEPALQAILASRRPSAPDEPAPWLFHLLLTPGVGNVVRSYETDRMRFIGRGRSAIDPIALEAEMLSGSAGAVLDAVAAIRAAFTLEAGASITLEWLTGVAESRHACLALAQRYRGDTAVRELLEHAGDHRRTILQRLQASDADAQLYDRMAAAILYADAGLRTDARVIDANRRGQSGLWGFGISGDLPIVLLQLSDTAALELVRQMCRAHAWWRANGIHCDLVIVCADGGGAGLEAVRETVAAGGEPVGKPGGIFVQEDAKLDDGDRILLQSVARVVIADAAGSLADQLGDGAPASAAADARATEAVAGMLAPLQDAAALDGAQAPAAPAPAERGNGHGRFSADGCEYIIDVAAERMTPAPWTNILANPDFGTLISESGSATTWSENAHEFRLTPWSNDPVSDPNTEAFYIRDESSGRYWSPTLLPTRRATPYVARHGFGYSVFEHREDGIESELTVFVARDAPVKFSSLELRNLSKHPRRLSVTGYCEWVLGDERAKTAMQVVTELDTATGALLARNDYHTDFAGRTAFFDVDVDVDGATRSACGDRADFLGPNGCLAAPAALARPELSGRVGAALDPCAALRVSFELAPGAARTVVFRLGAGLSADAARELVRRWRGDDAARSALEEVRLAWQRRLGTLQVQTPDPELDTLANGWLVYQIIASRLWGRTAFYQSSGAFGFRDQLQDVMALVHVEPGLVREHLLLAASRQFVEGDVQHWWHPPTGKGVRTLCSDDYLWLPLATCRYVEATGDSGVLDVECAFLEGTALPPGEASLYEEPKASGQSASLYEHCVRAIRHGLRYGQHGLPLMGSGDWNDGMNLVGAGGKGESVWLGFFLIAVLRGFAPLARQRSNPAFAELCETEAARLRQRIEESSWDGAWYRRAYFDNGAPLGSGGNVECKIDSIAQSWSVLSGAAPPERARRAMASVERHLVQRDSRLVQLLEPPFDTSEPSPGYIQGYVPGVRENGGQYTHAALWVALAFARLGDAERAWEVLGLLNPLHHVARPADAATYRIEPYVIAGDVYACAPHTGRGGWSWYTGSAGWCYRLIVDELLGFRRRGDRLQLRPLLPAAWPGFSLRYRHGTSCYEIACRRAASAGEAGLTLDGAEVAEVTLVDDGATHTVVATVWPLADTARARDSSDSPASSETPDMPAAPMRPGPAA